MPYFIGVDTSISFLDSQIHQLSSWCNFSKKDHHSAQDEQGEHLDLNFPEDINFIVYEERMLAILE